MKKSTSLAVAAFIVAVMLALGFALPPPTPWGRHSTLSAITCTIVGINNCYVQPGYQCKVIVGTGPNASRRCI